MAFGRKHKCSVCGLYEWPGHPHSGPLHARILANRKRRGRGGVRGRARTALGRFRRR